MITEDQAEKSAEALVEQFKKENPGAESSDGSRSAHVRKEGASRPPKVTAHYADVSSPDSVNGALDEILKEHGKIDHLVTSAGFTENFDAIIYPYERMKKL